MFDSFRLSESFCIPFPPQRLILDGVHSRLLSYISDCLVTRTRSRCAHALVRACVNTLACCSTWCSIVSGKETRASWGKHRCAGTPDECTRNSKVRFCYDAGSFLKPFCWLEGVQACWNILFCVKRYNVFSVLDKRWSFICHMCNYGWTWKWVCRSELSACAPVHVDGKCVCVCVPALKPLHKR